MDAGVHVDTGGRNLEPSTLYGYDFNINKGGMSEGRMTAGRKED